MIGIIGGTGFIGLNLSLYLQEQDMSCRTFSRNGLLLDRNSILYSRLSKIEHVKGNLRDPSAVKQFVKPCRRVVLLGPHLLPSSSLQEIEDVISWFGPSFVELLESCVAAEVEQFVFVSSGGTIYGETSSKSPITESHSLNSQCGYGAFCAFLEQLLRICNRHRGLSFTILRLGNPYGLLKPPNNEQGLIDHYIRSARARKPFTIFGDGSEVRDYIYIDDITRLLTHVFSSSHSNDTFNIGTGRGHTSLEVIGLTRERFALPEIPIVFSCRRPTDICRSILNMDKFAQTYGMRCSISLEEGLQKYAKLDHRVSLPYDASLLPELRLPRSHNGLA